MNRPSYLLFKQCSKCGEIKHISKFHKKQNEKYGVRKICKECRKEKSKIYYKNNKEYIDKRNKKYYEENKEEISKKKKIRYEENKEEISKKGKIYYEEHKEERREYSRIYNKEHKEERREYSKKYREENPHVKFNGHHKRKQKIENQGNGITKEQWLEMMEFFDFRCAYSGKYIGGDSDKRTIDHIIPLDNSGEHEIWNVVPMYANYNYSKHTKDMLEWYLQQEYFDIERLTKIYEWRIYAYWKYKGDK